MGVRSTCTGVWLRGISGGIHKCHMQTHLVCDGDQQQEAGPSFSKYGRLKLCRSASNVPTNRSTGVASAESRNGRWYWLDVALYHIINYVATQ